MNARSSAPWPAGPTGASRNTNRLEYTAPATNATANTPHPTRQLPADGPKCRRRGRHFGPSAAELVRRGRIAMSIARGAAMISALAWEYSPLPASGGEVEEGAGGRARSARRSSRRRSHQAAPRITASARDRRGETGQLGAAGGVEAVARGRPDAQRLDRRDRAVGVGSRDPVEAVDEGVGADHGQHSQAAEDDDRQRDGRLPHCPQQGPRRQRAGAPPARLPPQHDDRHRPGEPGEAVGEEDSAGQRQRHERRTAAPPSDGPAASIGTPSPRRRSRSWR